MPDDDSLDPPSAEVGGLLRYRLLTGTDDRAFCEKVSGALAQGYVLHGSPAITFDGQRPVAAQAVVLPLAPVVTQGVGVSRTGDVTPSVAWEALASDPDAVLVDVRTQAEWSFVGVPDLSPLGKEVVLAQWTTYPEGQRNGAFLDEVARAAGERRDAPVFFLCRSGQRSIGAADAAADAGWRATYNVLEGFEGPVADGHRGASGWRAAGLPWRQT